MIQWLINNRDAITNWLGFLQAVVVFTIQWLSTNPWNPAQLVLSLIVWIVAYFTGKSKKETKSI